MLDIAKFILIKTSADEKLFLKELAKIVERLDRNYHNDLQNWCTTNYGHIYGEKLKPYFKTAN